ncbi:DNA-processing protein DprA [Providencia rettgeri]|uniref:DNA-processing protein DprA n=1 Tax=Providencia rettgeri TaxID=587 RepID=UPI001B36DF8A|nr:DNA-processing protein DprA [Providencia rettgeri]MBQ0365104.1 DNA-protecting protein DprA [Providencia rettgeri]
MNLSPTAQATLLLTSYFSSANQGDVKPLTNTEWGRFALWLKANSLSPSDLLVSDPQSRLIGWDDKRISHERILQLLSRGHSLALAVEKWHRAGLWVVTRADTQYPWRLKKRLQTGCPPVLFGCGNKELLNAGGLAVVGSRNAIDSDLFFTTRIGELAAKSGVPLVSGGARGVDQSAMLGAAKQGGSVIGVLADSLLKAATSAKWRKGLMSGNTVLISPFYPEASFHVGNAMARNKYIYCLSDSGLVIHSGKKGGTLNGAEENLKNQWVPLWVKPTDDQTAANSYLVEKGAIWCEKEVEHIDITHLLVPPVLAFNQNEQADLFAQSDILEVEQPAKEPVTLKQIECVDFYGLFLDELARVAKEPKAISELIKQTGLLSQQLDEWLKRAEVEGRVTLLTDPLRVQIK